MDKAILTEEQSQSRAVAQYHDEVVRLKVVDEVSYRLMGNYPALLKKAIKFFDDLYDPRIKESNNHTKALREDKARLQKPAQAALQYANQELFAYEEQQAAIARAEAVKIAAEERQKEETKREQLATLAKEAGEEKLAESIIAAPREDPVVVPQVKLPDIEGRHYRESWEFQITDPSALPREYLAPDEQKIGKIVRALKQTTNIPGVRVFMRKIPVVRNA